MEGREYDPVPTARGADTMEGHQYSLANQERRRQVVIIGSGPAGLTAGIYTGRANLDPLLIDAPADTEKQTTPGGQFMVASNKKNYPQFSPVIHDPHHKIKKTKPPNRSVTEALR